jgi:uncharacterized membrane protein YkvA (DUF1232 family)
MKRPDSSGLIGRWKNGARAVKAHVYTLYFACRDPRVPWYARVFLGGVVAYAFSPIDLIPDFIPVLGYLDDLVIVPLGIYLGLRMIPPDVLAECRARATAAMGEKKPTSRAAGAVIVAIWVAAAVLSFILIRKAFGE